MSGMSARASHSVFTSVAHIMRSNTENLIIPVTVSQCTNLKSALHAIIQNVTNQSAQVDKDVPEDRQVNAGLFSCSGVLIIEGCSSSKLRSTNRPQTRTAALDKSTSTLLPP